MKSNNGSTRRWNLIRSRKSSLAIGASTRPEAAPCGCCPSMRLAKGCRSLPSRKSTRNTLPARAFPPFMRSGCSASIPWRVHGAYHVVSGRLRQTAQYSIYANESAPHLAAQCILNAFGGQLPLGRSTAIATASAAALEQQRAHHAMPRQWQQQLDEASLQAATTMLQGRGIAASNNAGGVWAELPLSGDCPSRSIDPQAETALLQVNSGVPHPIAGAGYLATISLPLASAPPDCAELCRRLNAMELAQLEFVPRLGAWGLQGPADLPGYSCFIPCAEPWSDFHVTLMWWCVVRAAWIRDRFWRAGAGLDLDSMREIIR